MYFSLPSVYREPRTISSPTRESTETVDLARIFLAPTPRSEVPELKGAEGHPLQAPDLMAHTGTKPSDLTILSFHQFQPEQAFLSARFQKCSRTGFQDFSITGSVKKLESRVRLVNSNRPLV